MQTVRLSDGAPMSAADIARVALAVAREVAELHHTGVVHGYIRPSRISVTGDRVELEPPDGAGFSKPHDVRSIGELTLYLLSRGGLPADGRLGEVARAAAALDPAARPTAEQLVDQLEQAVSAPDAPADVTRARSRVRLRPAIVVGSALVLVCGGMVLAWTRLATPEPPRPAPHRPERTAVAPGGPVPVSPDPLPAQVWPEEMRACPDAVGDLLADLDDDGCEEALEVREGRLVGVAGAVAISGVAVARHVTGDWHCSRRSTLAVLDADTGTIFVFPRWSRRGEQVPAMAVGQVPGAAALIAGDVDGDGCDDLRAVDARGTEVRIDVPVEARP